MCSQWWHTHTTLNLTSKISDLVFSLHLLWSQWSSLSGNPHESSNHHPRTVRHCSPVGPAGATQNWRHWQRGEKPARWPKVVRGGMAICLWLSNNRREREKQSMWLNHDSAEPASQLNKQTITQQIRSGYIHGSFLTVKAHLSCVPQILKRGCHVNDRDGLTDMTLLHYSCKAGAHGVGKISC